MLRVPAVGNGEQGCSPNPQARMPALPRRAFRRVHTSGDAPYLFCEGLGRRRSSAQGFPRFLIAHLDRHGPGAFRGRKDGQELQRFRASIVCGMNHPGGQTDRIAWNQQALLALDPLLGAPGQNIENLLHLRMIMKEVRLTGLDLDGNIENASIGGYFGGGRQIGCTGLEIVDNTGGVLVYRNGSA